MTRRPARELSEEDRILWNRVAVTTKPLKGRSSPVKAAPPFEAEGTAQPSPEPGRKLPAPPPPKPKPVVAGPATPRELDQPTRTKLARQRLSIDASVDLHGMTQSQAHGLLLSFLGRAHARGLRHVLVITGKGGSPGSEGVLRRAVPEWLATAPFRPLVSGHGAAARHHGGGGALYIRLRRQRS